MTYHDRKEIIRDLAKYYNWRLLGGFLYKFFGSAEKTILKKLKSDQTNGQ